MIDEEQKDSGLGLNEMRNMLIHNNEYADAIRILSIDEIKIEWVKNEIVQIPYQNYAYFSKSISNLYREWIESYLK